MDNNFALYKARLGARGSSEMDRMVRDKLDSFRYALAHSYNSEDIVKDGVRTKALINNEKLQMDYDHKTISIDFSVGLKVGDILLWERTNTHWLVILQHLTERAYFKGDLKKAIYEVRWRDENGVIFDQWVSVLGPTETKINEQVKKDVNFDTPNNSMTLWLGASDGTVALRRYKKIYVAGKVWQITSVDDTTTPSLVEVHLKEDLVDKTQDNIPEQLARDAEHMIVEINERVITGLDKISPLTGLSHSYTVTPSDVDGIWAIDPRYGSIATQDGTSATINFTGTAGSTQITYSINGVTVSSKNIKISSLLG